MAAPVRAALLAALAALAFVVPLALSAAPARAAGPSEAKDWLATIERSPDLQKKLDDAVDALLARNRQLRPENVRLSVIDLHRAQTRASVPRRWRDKDLAALYFSALDIGLTRRDALRFLKHYFQRPLRDILRDEARLLDWLEGKAARLRARYLRKYAPGASA